MVSKVKFWKVKPKVKRPPPMVSARSARIGPKLLARPLEDAELGVELIGEARGGRGQGHRRELRSSARHRTG